MLLVFLALCKCCDAQVAKVTRYIHIRDNQNSRASKLIPVEISYSSN